MSSWCLQKISDRSKTYLVRGKTYIVGRKSNSADIVIPNDASVSRKHAEVELHHATANLKDPEKMSYITICDSSKYGTFLSRGETKEAKISGKTRLQDKDIIKFGGQNSVYEVNYTPLVVTTSMANKETKDKTCEQILKLGGHYVNQWNDKITHVVMTSIKLSLKVTQALMFGCFIVTPEYFSKLLECASTNQNCNITSDIYLPKLDEPSLTIENDVFLVNLKRKRLMNDKTFLFFNEQQMKRLSTILTHGGGTVALISDLNLSSLNETVKSSNCIVIDNGSMNTTGVDNDKTNHVKTVLNTCSRRMVQEHEIGLSVVHCCTDVYCNPEFDLNSENMFSQYCSLPTKIDRNVNKPIPTENKNTKKRQRQTSPEKEDYKLNQSAKKAKININKVNKENNNNCDPIPKSPKQNSHHAKVSISDVQDTATIPNSCLVDDSLWSQNPALTTSNIGDINTKNTPETKNFKKPVLNEKPENENIIIKPEPITPKKFEPTKVNDNNNNSESAFPPYLNPMKYSIVSLHIKTNPNPTFITNTPTTELNVKNFKKFKKVLPTYRQNGNQNSYQDSTENIHSIPPRIIGGSDLIAYTAGSDKGNEISKWLNENNNTQDSQSENPFANL